MFMGSDVFRFREDSPRGEASNKAGCDAGICESLHQIAASLGHAIDAKDRSTSSHSRQVADLARCLALRAGLTPYQAEMIHIAGHLHDIGKIGIPDEILSKRAALTDAEHNAALTAFYATFGDVMDTDLLIECLSRNASSERRKVS